MTERVDIHGLKVYCLTDKAVQVGYPQSYVSDRTWIPLSQVLETDLDLESDECIYTEGYISMPLWLAKKSGFY